VRQARDRVGAADDRRVGADPGGSTIDGGGAALLLNDAARLTPQVCRIETVVS
jgi:hypothetical protein